MDHGCGNWDNVASLIKDRDAYKASKAKPDWLDVEKWTSIAREMQECPDRPQQQRDATRAYKNIKSMKDLILLLFETALLTSGFSLDDPNTFGNWIHKMLKVGLSIDDDSSASVEADEGMDETAADAEDNKMEEVD
ncbi:hypothetical protein L7F22_034055 [Adiantum nelumboides]|nr:hypothetical protein [Adiantum nelumboides]